MLFAVEYYQNINTITMTVAKDLVKTKIQK